MKTDSPVAALKTLETIRSTHQLSIAPALTVDRFQAVVQRALKLEHMGPSRRPMVTCASSFPWCSHLLKVRKWCQYKYCDTILLLVLAI